MTHSLFIITFGPAGSGKGYIMDALEKYLKNDNDIKMPLDYKYARIDDFIEVDKEYVKNSIDETINIFSDEHLTNYIDNMGDINNCITEIDNFLTNNKMSQELELLENKSLNYVKIYMDTRRKYNGTVDANINLWLSNREHIIFETTGQNNFDWLYEYTLLSNKDVKNDYKILLIYPYVETKIILARALNRFTTRVNMAKNVGKINSITDTQDENYIQYINNIVTKTKINNILPESPRLPTLVSGNYSIFYSINNIQNNIANYLNQCENDDKVNIILLYDNMQQEPILSVELKCKKIHFANSCLLLPEFNKKYGNHLTTNLKDAIIYIINHCNQNDSNQNGGNNNYRKYLKYKQKYLRNERK